MNRFSVVAHINGIRRLYRTNRYLTYASLKAPPPQTPKQTVTIYRFIEKRNTGPFIVQMGATSPPPLPPFRRPFSLPPPPGAPLHPPLHFCVVCVLCAKKSVDLYSTQDVVKTRKCVTRMRTHDHRLGGRASEREEERERERESCHRRSRRRRRRRPSAVAAP